MPPRRFAAALLIAAGLPAALTAQERPPRSGESVAEPGVQAAVKVLSYPQGVIGAERVLPPFAPPPADGQRPDWTPAPAGWLPQGPATGVSAAASGAAAPAPSATPGGPTPAAPNAGNPVAAPSIGAAPAAIPARAQLRESDADFAACLQELSRLGTEYTLEAPVTGEMADCGIDRPLRVTAVLPGITLEGGALMRCGTARALGAWMTDFVIPAARRLPGAPRPARMSLGSTYQCRATIGGSTDSLSEHALGNAIDIGSFAMDDGTTIPVEEARKGSPAEAFLLAVRWSACMDFGTVLGPGSNAAHGGHLHLDIKARNGGYRVCE